MINQTEENYDREKEVNEFEQTKLGVKGLVDSGITQVPRIFHHPPENLIPIPDPNPNPNPIPVIDLLGTPREEVVNQVREASAKYGFLQVVNHGIPVSMLVRLNSGLKAFHELPGEERMKHSVRRHDAVCSNF
mgnify:CR=1 FL=1